MSPQEHMSLKEICNAARETIKPFTTGEVARYCGVSRMGVIRWIQQGKLKAYVTPGGHYRIQATDFYAFLERFNMPLYNLARHIEVKRILVVADDTPTLGIIMKVLGQLSTECEIKVALDILAAKSKLTTFQPTLIVLSSSVAQVNTDTMLRWIKGQKSIPILILAPPGERGTDPQPQRPDISARARETPFACRVPLEVNLLRPTLKRLLAA